MRVNEDDRLLILAPHPDDECIGCGGLLAMYPSQCEVIVFTDGSMDGSGVFPSLLANIRRQELDDEMTVAGVNCWRMLGKRDSYLTSDEDCCADIHFELYNKIFLPWGNDNHPDHTALFFFAMKEICKKNIDAEIYQYEVHIPLHDVTDYLDITEYIEKKIDLIRCHKSQNRIKNYDRISYALASYRAEASGFPNRFFEVYLRTPRDAFEKDLDRLQYDMKLQKFQCFFRILLRWINRELDGKKISDSLKNNGYSSVAIYGASELGVLLYRSLRKEEIQVECFIDKRLAGERRSGIDVLFPDERDVYPDAVVVTAVQDYENIYQELKKCGYRNIIPLDGLVYGDKNDGE